jgi:hypothetical protein
MMVCCLFFNFKGQFDFGCCSLAQEMNFVAHYLPCFREWLITGLLSTFLPFQHLFTDSSAELVPCPSPFLQHFWQSCPFHCVLDYSSLFIVQFFFWGWWSVCSVAVLVYPGGGWGNSA